MLLNSVWGPLVLAVNVAMNEGGEKEKSLSTKQKDRKDRKIERERELAGWSCVPSDCSAVCGPIWLKLWWVVGWVMGTIATWWRPDRPPGGAARV